MCSVCVVVVLVVVVVTAAMRAMRKKATQPTLLSNISKREGYRESSAGGGGHGSSRTTKEGRTRGEVTVAPSADGFAEVEWADFAQGRRRAQSSHTLVPDPVPSPVFSASPRPALVNLLPAVGKSCCERPLLHEPECSLACSVLCAKSCPRQSTDDG